MLWRAIRGRIRWTMSTALGDVPWESGIQMYVGNVVWVVYNFRQVDLEMSLAMAPVIMPDNIR